MPPQLSPSPRESSKTRWPRRSRPWAMLWSSSRGSMADMVLPHSSTSDMVFSRKDGLVKQTAAKGNQVTQKFDVTVRFLGFVASSMTAGAGQASGGTTPASLSTQDLLWQVVSEGSANIPTSNTTYLQFRQRREVIGVQSLGQSQASNPTATP